MRDFIAALAYDLGDPVCGLSALSTVFVPLSCSQGCLPKPFWYVVYFVHLSPSYRTLPKNSCRKFKLDLITLQSFTLTC